MPMSKRFEDILAALGPSGRYHLCQYIWLFVSLLTSGFGILGYVFIGQSVPHKCAPLSEQSLSNILADLGIPVSDVTSNTTVLNECTIDVNITTATTSQTTTVECVDGQDFGPPPFTSVVSEFNLVCDRALLSRLPQFFFTVLQIIGGIIIPIIADKLGRKPLFIASHAMALILAITQAFPRSIEFYYVVKALSGAFIEGLLLLTVAMTVELTRVNDRKLVSVGLIISWFTSGLTLVALSFGLRMASWRILQYAQAAASGVIFIQIYVIEESIRWLFAVGRDREAVALVTKAARLNKVDIKTVLGPDDPEKDEPLASKEEETDVGTSGADTEGREGSPNDPIGNTTGPSTTTEPARVLPSGNAAVSLPNASDSPSGSTSVSSPNGITSPNGATLPSLNGTDTPNVNGALASPTGTSSAVPAPPTGNIGAGPETALVVSDTEHSNKPRSNGRRHLVINTVIFVYLWLVTGFSFYALYFTGSVFSDDIYLNFTINVLSEVPAAIVIVFGVDSIGRKNVIYVFLGLAVVFLVCVSIITLFAVASVQSILLPIFGLIGKLGVAGTFFTLFLYTGETYPTNFRLIGLGISSVSGRIGALGAPFLVLLSDDLSWLPTALIAGLLLIGIFATFPLPETKGKELPQSIEDVEDLYKK